MSPGVPINIGTEQTPEIIDLQRVSLVTIYPDPDPTRAWVQLFLPCGHRFLKGREI